MNKLTRLKAPLWMTARVVMMLLMMIVSPMALKAAVPHFSWGADAGGAIDMTSNNMSTINIDAYFGYRSAVIDMAGIGAGMNIMVNNSNRTFPVYGIIRTSFTSRPSLAFLDFRAGCAFNSFANAENQSSLFVSPGVGFHLARSDNFRSYVILSYVFNDVKPYNDGPHYYDIHGLHFASLRIGISF